MLTNQPESVSFSEGAYALLIGVATFTDKKYKSSPLPQTVNDVDDFQNLLVSRLGWDGANIVAIQGQVSKKAVGAGFREIADRMARNKTKRLFLFYLSTHGHPYKTARDTVETVFLASNTEVSTIFKLTDTGLTRFALAAYLDAIDSDQKVIISDACFAAGSLATLAIAPHSVYHKMDVAVVSAAIDRSYIIPNAQNSAFTAAFISAASSAIGEVDLGTVAAGAKRLLKIELSKHGYPPQEPFLDSRGQLIDIGVVGVENVEKRTLTRENLVSYLRGKLSFATAERLDTSRFVPRVAIEQSFPEFRASSRRIFTIVGPAGAGKSTVMAQLAKQLLSEKAIVFWMSAGIVTPKESALNLLNRYLVGLGKRVTFAELPNHTDEQGIFVFLDAINEWALSPSEMADTLTSFLALGAELPFRLIVSCREESWSEFKPILSEDLNANTTGIDAAIGDFGDGPELEAARAVYPIVSLISDPILKRKPLFLRMLTDSGSALSTATEISYSEVFQLYIGQITDAVADQLSLSSAVVHTRLMDVIRLMYARDALQFPAAEFIGTASESIAVAFLDLGLFRRQQDSIVVESELLHEYLLSFLLPANPFEDLAERSHTGQWWGAAAFRIIRLNNPALVRAILRKLLNQRGDKYYVLRIFERVRNPQDFSTEFLALIAQWNLYDAISTAEDFEPVIARYLQFSPAIAFEALRLLLITDDAYDWERKRWRNLGSAEIRKRFEDQGLVPKLLIRAVQSAPMKACNVLLNNWASDSTPFRNGNEAKVSGVAETLLCFLAQESPDELLNALDAMLLSPSTDIQNWNFRDALADLARTSPRLSLDYASRWYQTISAGPDFALMILANIPPSLTSELIDFSTRWLDHPSVSVKQANLIVSQLGNIKARGIVTFLIKSQRKHSELTAGIVHSLRALCGDFPEEILKAIERIARKPWSVVFPEPVKALVGFYTSHLAIASREATRFFQVVCDLSTLANTGLERDIAYGFQSAPASPHITRFVEQRLKVGKNGQALELYFYYIKNVRQLNSGDLEWLCEWAKSGTPVYGALKQLMISKMPFEDLVRFIAQACLSDEGFYSRTHNIYDGSDAEELLRQFSVRYVPIPVFASITGANRLWFELLASGKGIEAATSEVRRFQL